MALKAINSSWTVRTVRQGTPVIPNDSTEARPAFDERHSLPLCSARRANNGSLFNRPDAHPAAQRRPDSSSRSVLVEILAAAASCPLAFIVGPSLASYRYAGSSSSQSTEGASRTLSSLQHLHSMLPSAAASGSRPQRVSSTGAVVALHAYCLSTLVLQQSRKDDRFQMRVLQATLVVVLCLLWEAMVIRQESAADTMVVGAGVIPPLVTGALVISAIAHELLRCMRGGNGVPAGDGVPSKPDDSTAYPEKTTPELGL
ncbi:hypothetical protein GGR56DRAFT_645327 [Xylariaceae sp. FL0804]|nr:hypothetical protein GGR56DRAFT_645327 [Xylariaceae sp. FL0804]